MKKVAKTRRVLDHYDISYSYRDNGNGTFSKVEHKTPVYKNETYYETVKEPVYRQDPVYDTKYYYEIERWYDVRDYKTSGVDKNPYWSTEYTLGAKERDTDRREWYEIVYDTGKTQTIPYKEWGGYELGDKFISYKSLLGITYNRELLVA